ncbi:MAG: hypothetical protein ACKVIX_06430 [Sphingomonadales bacterium]
MKFLKIIGIIGLALMASTTTLAKDCGFSPDYYPILPDAITSTRVDLRVAVQAVRAFGEVTNAHLNCLDESRAEVFLNMSKEQQSRWLEDYNKIVEDLTNLEEGLNVQIREFNAKSVAKKSTDGNLPSNN